MQDLLRICYIASATIGLICYRRMTDKPVRVLALYWSGMVVIDLSLEQLESGEERVIRFFYCLIHAIALGVYVYVFNQNVPKKSLRFVVQYIMIGLVSLFALYQIAFSLDDTTSADDVFLIQGICTLCIVLFYFRDILVSKEIIILTQEPIFWIATGVLFYTTGNLIATGFFHQMYVYSKPLALSMYKLNYILNIIMSLLFGVAFVISTRKLRTNVDGY